MKKNLEKIFFELDSSDWHNCSTESMWAEVMLNPDTNKDEFTPDSIVFQLMNSPFYAKGVNFLDIVFVTYVEAKKTYYFRKVMKYSGHSTYRLLVDNVNADFTEYWLKLKNLGCTYESGKEGERMLYAVDVPPDSSIKDVHEIIKQGQDNKIWLFEVGHVVHHNYKNK